MKNKKLSFISLMTAAAVTLTSCSSGGQTAGPTSSRDTQAAETNLITSLDTTRTPDSRETKISEKPADTAAYPEYDGAGFTVPDLPDFDLFTEEEIYVKDLDVIFLESNAKYTGTWKNGYPEGHGRIDMLGLDYSGVYLEGEWSEGILDGVINFSVTTDDGINMNVSASFVGNDFAGPYVADAVIPLEDGSVSYSKLFGDFYDTSQNIVATSNEEGRILEIGTGWDDNYTSFVNREYSDGVLDPNVYGGLKLHISMDYPITGEWDGLYFGTLENSLPNGPGVFVSDGYAKNEKNTHLYLLGGWKNGRASGKFSIFELSESYSNYIELEYAEDGSLVGDSYELSKSPDKEIAVDFDYTSYYDLVQCDDGKYRGSYKTISTYYELIGTATYEYRRLCADTKNGQPYCEGEFYVYDSNDELVNSGALDRYGNWVEGVLNEDGEMVPVTTTAPVTTVPVTTTAPSTTTSYYIDPIKAGIGAALVVGGLAVAGTLISAKFSSGGSSKKPSWGEQYAQKVHDSYARETENYNQNKQRKNDLLSEARSYEETGDYDEARRLRDEANSIALYIW